MPKAPAKPRKLLQNPAILVFAALGIATLAVVVVGQYVSAPPATCPKTTTQGPTRCCAPGQSEESGTCVGTPQSCPPKFTAIDKSCVTQPSRILIPPGTVRIGPGDWEAQRQVAPRDITITSPFLIDSHEVTFHRYAECVEANACSKPSINGEPGQPVRGINYHQAIAFCTWASGELPTEDMWTMAAAGTESRRYPWGDSGAVCRRANWGRTDGPCSKYSSNNSGATDEVGPDWAGITDLDQTPEGVIGLAGGVSEWVKSANPGMIKGGSFRTNRASLLRTWWFEQRDPTTGYDDVGLRCAYIIPNQ